MFKDVRAINSSSSAEWEEKSEGRAGECRVTKCLPREGRMGGNLREWEGEQRSAYTHTNPPPLSTPLSHSYGKSQGFLLIEVKSSEHLLFPVGKSGHFYAEVEQLRLAPCRIRRTTQLAPDSTMWHETQSSDSDVQQKRWERDSCDDAYR